MAVGKRKYTLEDIISAYERRQVGVINSIVAQIITLFEEKSTTLAYLYAKRKLVGNRFLPKDIRDTIDRITSTVNAKSKELIIVGIRKSFSNSEEKNNLIETKVATNGRRIPPGKTSTLTAVGLFGDENALTTAVNEFIKRKTEGLNLSARVWKLSNSWKKTMNDTLLQGLKDGTSARELAQLLKKATRNGANVTNPGQGVYKSPVKNAFRLARNEINLAYANADYQRWQLVETVVAIEVRVSNSHPKYDMCDQLKGKYPKDFHYTRWHVSCLCIAVPVLATREERDELMDYKLGLRATPPNIKYLNEIPGSAKTWIQKNAARVEGWKSKPYWWTLNKGVVASAKKAA